MEGVANESVNISPELRLLAQPIAMLHEHFLFLAHTSVYSHQKNTLSKQRLNFNSCCRRGLSNDAAVGILALDRSIIIFHCRELRQLRLFLRFKHNVIVLQKPGAHLGTIKWIIHHHYFVRVGSYFVRVEWFTPFYHQ